MPTETELLTDTKLMDTKLLFGLRTNQQVTLTVVGQPGSQAPELWILSRGQQTYTVIAYDRDHGHWATALAAGDHIVRMDAPGDSWFAGEVTFTLGTEQTIVVCDDKAMWQPVSWVAANGVVNDPKYPSPPLRAASQVTGSDWLPGTLKPLYEQLASRRGAPDLRAIPARSAAPPATE